MQVERFQPSPALQPFVKTLMIIESENGMDSRVLPVTSIVLAFTIKGKVLQKNEKDIESLPSVMLSGLRNSMRGVNYFKQSAMLLVFFQEGSANAFFREPMQELFGINLPAESLLGRSVISEIEERLSAVETNREKVEIVEKFLVSRLKEGKTDKLIYNAVQKIKADGGNTKTKELLDLFHISHDPFKKRFRRSAGTSPKQFSQIIRLRNLVNLYSPENNLTELAIEAGYFDQSHFIKDIKSFTGLTPRQFFKSTYYW